MTVAVVSERLGRGEKWVLREIRTGALPEIWAGRHYRISEQDFTDYIERSRIFPTQKYSDDFRGVVRTQLHEAAERICDILGT